MPQHLPSFADLLRALPDGAIVYAAVRDGEGEVIDFTPVAANAAAATLTGVAVETLLACPVSAYLGPEAAPGAIASLRRVLQTATPLRYATVARVATGAVLDMRITPLGDGVLASFRNRGDGEDADGPIGDLRSRIELAAEVARIGVWEYWPQIDRLIWSEMTRTIYGMTDTPLTGSFQDFASLVAPEQRHRLKAANDDLAQGAAQQEDWRLVPPDGQERWVHSRSKVLSYDAAGRPERIIGASLDVTERRQLQERLERSQRAAEAAAEAKSRFLATMSHEIRTPLNGVLGMAELLDKTAADPDQRRKIAVIRDAGALLRIIIDDVLEQARIDAGKLTLDVIAFDPIAVACGVVEASRPAAQAKGLSLTLGACPAAPMRRLGDPHRLAQVMHNLIGNAIKFTEAGGIEVALDAPDDAPLRIEVRDSGVGMTDAQMAAAFEAFTQADGSIARRYGGSGLGLSIARGVMAAMGGALTLAHREGGGLIARVTAPLAQAPAAPATPSLPGVAPLAGLRVLAVDDNEINRMVVEEMLGRIGCAPTLADSGEAALALRAGGAFDAMLLDIAMPGMDGLETLTALRALEQAQGLPRLPAIACTANVMSDQIARYHAHGFDAHLGKPIAMAALAETLGRLGALA